MAKKKKKKYRKFWNFIKIQIVLIGLIVAGLAYYYLGGYAATIRDLKAEAETMVRTSDEESFREAQTSLVYDANGDMISTLSGEKDVYYLSLEEIPMNVRAAIVSIEDKKFYQHGGIDYRAIIRAVVAMLRDGEVTQGASTITQQLSRNVFLTQDKTWERKIEEIFIAIRLEKKYTKEQILEYYLNNIYFGNGHYGIEAASKGYFDTEITKLSLSQQAFLCAIPNNPTLYDPIINMENTLSRRNRILENMYQDNLITRTAYMEALAEQITLNIPEKEEKNNYAETYIYYCATRHLMAEQGFEFQNTFTSEEEEAAYDEAYGEMYAQCQQTLYTAGYRIYTSIDLNAQQQLQDSLDAQLSAFDEVNEEGIYALQGAAVSIDNQTGYVNAIIGGRSQEYDGYTLNRAYQSFRQPGSAIKPLIVYTPALENEYTPDTIVVDEPIENGPTNSNGSYAGAMSLRAAVAQSKNTVAWNLFEELTPQTGLEYLLNMNFARIDSQDYRPASALGGFTNGASAVEMAAAYETIENDGVYRMPTCIRKITDAQGMSIFENEFEEKTIYKQNAARMMTDMMETVMSEGTGRGLDLGAMPSAGKTGTTNDNKDGWFVGYTHYYTTAVWVGYDMPREMDGLAGATYPGRIWQEYMLKIHDGLTPIDFVDYVNYETPETDVTQPTETIDQPAQATEQPVETIDQPTQDLDQPTQNTDEPVQNTDQPTPNTDQQIETIDQPIQNTDQPTQDADQPVEEPQE